MTTLVYKQLRVVYNNRSLDNQASALIEADHPTHTEATRIGYLNGPFHAVGSTQREPGTLLSAAAPAGPGPRG
jgi:hypothetical protein